MADSLVQVPGVGHVELIDEPEDPVLLLRFAQRLVKTDVFIATLFLFAVLILAFYEIIFGGKTLVSAGAPGVLGSTVVNGAPYGYDPKTPPPVDPYRLDRGASAWLYEPVAAKVRHSYKDLRLPLWNANYGGGGPLMAGMMTPVLDVIEAPVLLFGSPLSWDIYLVGRFFLAGLFVFLFARAIGLSNPASLVASVGMIFCGTFMMFSNNPYLDVYVALPLLLFAIEKSIQTMRPRYAALQAVSVVMVLMGGIPEGSFVSLLLAGFYSVYRMGSAYYEDRTPSLLPRRLLFITVGFGAGLMLAAPVLLPFSEFIQNSHTSHDGSIPYGMGYDPAKFLGNILVPYIDGTPGLSATAKTWSGTHNWVGMVLPLFAVVGLWNRRLGPRAGWFFAVAALVGFAKCYGAPTINDVGSLPLAKLTIFQQWLGPLNALSVAIAAGVGVDRIARGERLRWSLPAALTIYSLLVLWAFHKNWLFVSHLPDVGRMWLEVGLFLTILAAVVMWSADRMHGPTLGWVCLAVASAELLLFVPHGNYRDRADTFAKPPFVQYLQDQPVSNRSRIYGLNAILYPDSSSVYNIDDIRYLDGLYPDRYFDYINQFVSPGITDRFVGHDPAVSYVGNPYFDLLGARYVMTDKAGLPAKSSIADDLVKTLGKTAQHDVTDFTINGETKHVLFEHAPGDVPLDLQVTPQSHVLRFSAAMNPQMWDQTGNTGVRFEVWASKDADTPLELVWSRVVDPVELPADKSWVDGEVDLSKYGSKPKVSLRTEMTNPSNAYDWSGWGGLELSGTKSQAQQFSLVYDKEVRIYQNNDALSRAFVASKVTQTADRKASLDAMKQLSFDPHSEAIVEGRLSPKEQDLLKASDAAKDGSSVSIQSYTDDNVKLTAHMQTPGVVILTDSYYPGWKVYVDGKKADIHVADYAFRGIVIPEGDHNIEFRYSPTSFKAGVAVALLAILGFTAWFAFDRRRTRKRRDVTTEA